ncbi:hypothetical protein CT3_29940 [Comamonas terrigena NBRC 13299]|nr:hypothetical protein CT3_29940 [Comamonas terrigena NBRC 13299]
MIGVFALYFREPRSPNALHHRIAQTCIHLCTVAMERERSRERIHQLAYYDPLTQLPNRCMFHRSATDALYAAQGRAGALLFVDLDRFKLVNDSQGHAAGDALLCEVAQRIRAAARPGDVLGRLSSDEFALLLPHCSAAEAETVARRLLERIAEPFTIGDAVNIPHASVGICAYPEDGTDIHTLLRHADQAMYIAKQQGRQRWQRFTRPSTSSPRTAWPWSTRCAPPCTTASCSCTTSPRCSAASPSACMASRHWPAGSTRNGVMSRRCVSSPWPKTPA